jgi:hypothetical protein
LHAAARKVCSLERKPQILRSAKPSSSKPSFQSPKPKAKQASKKQPRMLTARLRLHRAPHLSKFGFALWQDGYAGARFHSSGVPHDTPPPRTFEKKTLFFYLPFSAFRLPCFNRKFQNKPPVARSHEKTQLRQLRAWFISFARFFWLGCMSVVWAGSCFVVQHFHPHKKTPGLIPRPSWSVKNLLIDNNAVDASGHISEEKVRLRGSHRFDGVCTLLMLNRRFFCLMLQLKTLLKLASLESSGSQEDLQKDITELNAIINCVHHVKVAAHQPTHAISTCFFFCHYNCIVLLSVLPEI